MIFDLLAPPQGPRGRGPKNNADACGIHVSNSHTKSVWISEKKRYPQVPALGHDPGGQMKISSDMCYIFHL